MESQTSLWHILKTLNLFPYKIQLVQQLKPPDYAYRLQYAARFQELARGDPKFIHKLIMPDEAHFHFNKQNCRIWGLENSRTVHQRELHPLKCMDLTLSKTMLGTLSMLQEMNIGL